MHESLFNYNIIRVLGEGGMSRVYLGEDPTTQQQVAIKELLPNLAHSKDLRERFRREAQIMAKLDHPNIVKLLKFEETSTSFYLIMEFVDGIDLELHIKNVTGPISEPKAIEILSVLLDTFGYAHEKGVVHRDIKPANIIITRDGIVKVLDFGIAKIIDDESGSKTKTGTRIGTVAYMSPEQVNALADIDLRTDIYSLGVLLHQMITGTAPYDTSTSSDFEVQTKIVKEPLPRAKGIYPYASDHLQSLIDNATHKNRENRFQDCDQFKLALLQKKSLKSVHTNSEKGGTSEPEEINHVAAWFIGIVIFVFIIAIAANAFKDLSPKDSEFVTAVDSTVIAVDTVAVVDTVAPDFVNEDLVSSDDYNENNSLQDRTINSPRYESRNNEDIAILSIKITNGYTLVKMRFTNQSGVDRQLYTGKPGSSDAFYVLTSDGSKYELTWTDLPEVNEAINLNTNYYYDFNLQFSAIPLSTTLITLVEGTGNSWGFKKVYVGN